MSSNQELSSLAREVQLGVYRTAPVAITEASGCRARDADGRWYLDLCAGIAVVSVGHCHPRLTAAVSEQAARLIHISNLFYNERAVGLAAELRKRTPFGGFFFCNSGAEANEAMLKIARRYHHSRGDGGRIEIVSTHGAFHGRSAGALTVTGEPKYKEGIEPLMGGVRHVAYDDLSALEAAVDDKTAAVILEPIQGENGIIVPGDDYLPGARRICDAAGALLLFDEVQTGYGRTGKFLALEHGGVVPDACSLAKGIAAGFPLGALAVVDRLRSTLVPGSHGSTYGGNPVACAAALAVLAIFDEENLVANAERVGAHLGTRLDALVADSAIPAAVGSRGRGLLRGIELGKGIDPLATLDAVREAGVLLSLAGGNILRFTPPLCVRPEEIDEGVEIVASVLRDPPAKKE
jgi:predicted acetylornithine/succinylornithine family transaminase